MIRKDDTPRFIGGDGWTESVDLPQGYSVRVHVDYDQDMGPPWDNSDGHGPVRVDLKENKAPGERILGQAGARDQWYLYDFAEAVKIARRDGWGDGDGGRLTGGAKAAHAAEADYAFLRGWCNDQWHYLVVGVEVSRNGAVIELDYCGGIEDLGDYWREHAADHARYVIEHDIKARRAAAVAAAKETRERKYWAARDVITA